MFESDADRAAMIDALGGVGVSTAVGTFDGLFEEDYVGVGDGAPVESYGPRLIARTADVRRCKVANGTALTIEATPYIVRSVQDDRTGMTVMVLEAP